MIRNWTLYGALAISVLALAACGETPTEPERTGPLPSTLSAVAAVSDTWIARANMARSRADPVVGTITNPAGESILYAFGGSTPDGQVSRTVQAYNVSTNTWTLAAPMPTKVIVTNGVGVIGGKLYISGGITPPTQIRRTLFVYDPSTNTWTKKRGMPSQGAVGVTGVISNRLYVLTGCPAGSTCDPFIPLAFYRYDPGTDRWRTLPTPTTAHAGGMGGVIGGKFYVAGGEAVSQLDVYDPLTNAWTTKASLPQKRWHSGAATLRAKLYVIGGVDYNPDGSQKLISTTSVYDPITDTWTNQAPIPTERANLAASRVLLNGQPRIEVVGGGYPDARNNIQYIP